MSLEQALAENTAALRALTAALGNAPLAAAPAPAPTLPAGTRYFLNTKHSTVYKLEPTDPQVVLPDSQEIDAATYATKKAEFDKKTDAAIAATSRTAEAGKADAQSPKGENSAPAGGDADDPFAEPAAPKLDLKTVTEKLQALAKAKGNDAVKKILGDIGAARVSLIPADKFQAAYDAATAALK